MLRWIFQDWQVNHNSFKGRIIMVLFRLAYIVRNNNVLSILFFWYLVLYKIIVGWIFNVDFNTYVKVGSGLKLNYGFGSVIHGKVEIGNNCTLRQLTTISCKRSIDGSYGDAPKIGNNVDIGVNVTIIGDIKIGDNVTIGAGSVVTKSVPDNSVIIGNPAQILKQIYYA
jgi:putative colanic acid biosynthesis acetyltransferase WcaB